MEQKLVKVPFEVELAKEITNGTKEGKVVTRNGRNARIICWDAHCDDNIVALIEDEKGVEFPQSYVSDGLVFLTGESDCDLMLEIPEQMTFKDGDILYARVKNGNWYVFIYRDNGKDKTFFYAAIDDKGKLFIEKNRITDNNDISELRFATDEEKQKLIDALKASREPKAKEYLKRFSPKYSNSLNIGKNYEFKPFDKVLARECETDKWRADLFSHMNEKGEFICIGYVWDECIPYNDQTKHLLGTTDNWEE